LIKSAVGGEEEEEMLRAASIEDGLCDTVLVNELCGHQQVEEENNAEPHMKSIARYLGTERLEYIPESGRGEGTEGGEGRQRLGEPITTEPLTSTYTESEFQKINSLILVGGRLKYS
jgi:hypothetical protein